MTDLDASGASTVTCPRCGGQNDPVRSVCRHCGASLADAAGDTEDTRGDLELEEVWRSLAVEGYDAELGLDRGWAVCPVCGTRFPPRGSVVEGARDVRDTPTRRDTVAALALRCPNCGTAGRLAAVPEALELVEPSPVAEPADAVEPGTPVERGEVPWRQPDKPGASADRPLGDDRRFFVPVDDDRSLRERGPLVDEEGDDIREYTGEPVETEEGTVLPQQQNVGPGNEAGGGEWPDPDAPPAQRRHG